jgi:GntR family transcriptional regulator, trigonelline degradation regulator
MNATDKDVLRLERPPVMVRQLAADALRRAILAGALKPGERLVEATLTKRMGVSRSSVREALSQLAAEKLVAVLPHRGPSVATITWEEAAEIYHVRALLEGEAAALFAARAKREQVAGMRRALREFERAISKGDVAQLVSATSDFYRVLLESCGNRIIGEVLHGLNARISFLRGRSMSRPGRPPHSLVEMAAILEALERRDAEGARRASSQHVYRASLAARESFREVASEASQLAEREVKP